MGPNPIGDVPLVGIDFLVGFIVVVMCLSFGISIFLGRSD